MSMTPHIRLGNDRKRRRLHLLKDDLLVLQSAPRDPGASNGRQPACIELNPRVTRSIVPPKLLKAIHHLNDDRIDWILVHRTHDLTRRDRPQHVKPLLKQTKRRIVAVEMG